MTLFEDIVGSRGVLTKADGEKPRCAPRILAVEDDRFGQVAIQRVLERAGYNVTIAHDRASALRALAESDFALVLSDFRFPGGTGLDLLAEARRVKPDMPFLFLSGEIDAGLKQRARDMGALAFLEKPVALQRLLDEMHLALATGDDR